MVIFTLLPESKPVNQWMKSNEHLLSHQKIKEFIETLEIQSLLLNIEDFDGYYDSKNVQNFLINFGVEAGYPKSFSFLLRKSLRASSDYRVNPIEDLDEKYQIYYLPIQDHTFSEIAERKLTHSSTCILVNYQAHSLPSTFEVRKNGKSINIDSVEDIPQLSQWISKNRNSIRNFQITPKHGENRLHSIKWNGKDASPLKCSRLEATKFLKIAVGFTQKELFAFDETHQSFLVFKYEGNNPQNMYHGYHIPQNSKEIPEEIKQLITQIKPSK